MITGLGSARDLAQGKRGAFYNTLEEFHTYWDHIDIIVPRVHGVGFVELFGNVHLHISPWPLIFHPIFFIKKSVTLHKKYHFDAITVQDFAPFYNGFGAFVLWLFIKVPYILEFHHITGYPKSANLKEWLYRVYAQMFVAIDAWPARAVRVVNQHQTKEFLVKAGVPEAKIKYIPSLYIDHNVFKPNNEPKIYDLIFVGRLAKNKGIELFIDSAKKLGLRTLIVGDGPEKYFVQKSIQGFDNIILHGWAKDSEEIAGLLNQSKLFVLTSYNEGGPRVVAEAMACGVPVLSTPVGIVPDFKDACTIIDWNVSDIVQKAKILLDDDNLYQTKSKLGLKIVEQFQKESAIKNYAENVADLI